MLFGIWIEGELFGIPERLIAFLPKNPRFSSIAVFSLGYMEFETGKYLIVKQDA